MNKRYTILMLVLFGILLFCQTYKLHVWFEGSTNNLETIVKIDCFQCALFVIGLIASINKLIERYYKKHG